ncbi:hypothetical protein CFC21_106311 [Triticum aestivum]|uniref:KIB1-4 beta-propeller domain-containing protein n=2 Tax=Triticum aestivum TaxID=4565 RepID=A0A3B6SM02_WHEAT|nr:hypothetical protein CFC21_106311 [Triticum aestivum]
MPWINLGRGRYQDLAGNGKVRSFATPKGYRAPATFDGWVLYEHKRSHRCFLGDPFSPSTPAIEVPCHCERTCRQDVLVCGESDVLRTGCEYNPNTSSPLRKIIVCSSQLVVALFDICSLIKIGWFRPGTTKIQPATLSWSNTPFTWYQDPQGHDWSIIYEDIAFHRGKIFALSSRENLFTYELVLGKTRLSQTCSTSRVEHVIKEGPGGAAMVNTRYVQRHLVTSSDKQKLLMVRWSVPCQMDRVKFNHCWAMDLQVFEADLQKGRWSEVKDLGSQVLVVGQTSSRALVVAGSSERSFRGNCVFLLGDNCPKLCYAVPSYCVYDMISGEASLVSLSRGRGRTNFSKMSWFFPSE